MRRLLPIAILVIALAFAASITPLVASSPTQTSTIAVMTWNVESGGADGVTIAGQIAAFDGIDLWGLMEVHSDDAILYESAAEVGEDADFSRVVGSTGGGDRLVAIYDEVRFDLLGTGELHDINIGGNVRAPLVITLTETATDLQFVFMVNHLYRSNDEGRRTQAIMLNEWASNQTLPVIAVGDYNFDWAVSGTSRDLGYDLMTNNSVWEWIKPDTLVTTQCSGWPCTYNSVLDFVFVAGLARDWQATSEIIVRDGDFPDDSITSDHRPVKASFIVSVSEADAEEGVYLPLILGNDNATHPIPTTMPTGEATSTPTPTATATIEASTSTPTPTATSTSPETPIPTPTATATTMMQPTHTPTPTATAPVGAVCDCSGNIYNCPDFPTQGAAQACFNYCVSQGRGDIHRLDNDSDGVACESLPSWLR